VRAFDHLATYRRTAFAPGMVSGIRKNPALFDDQFHRRVNRAEHNDGNGQTV
jgi:hypothetical protein